MAGVGQPREQDERKERAWFIGEGIERIGENK
jgi:hypothetical protein